MGENEEILVSYGVVQNVMGTMSELAAEANNLQLGLAGLESDIRSQYASAETTTIIKNYSDFMAEMAKIKNDIDAVNEWCENVVTKMKEVETANAEEMASVTALQG